MLKQESKFAEFLDMLRSPKTERNYKDSISCLVGDADAFYLQARTDPALAEKQLIEIIKEKRGRLAPATLNNRVGALRSFFEYSEVKGINWSKVAKAQPANQKVADDRPPTLEEVRKLLTVCDVRMRFVVLFLLSSGTRIGALRISTRRQELRFPPPAGRRDHRLREGPGARGRQEKPGEDTRAPCEGSENRRCPAEPEEGRPSGYLNSRCGRIGRY